MKKETTDKFIDIAIGFALFCGGIFLLLLGCSAAYYILTAAK